MKYPWPCLPSLMDKQVLRLLMKIQILSEEGLLSLSFPNITLKGVDFIFPSLCLTTIISVHPNNVFLLECKNDFNCFIINIYKNLIYTKNFTNKNFYMNLNFNISIILKSIYHKVVSHRSKSSLLLSLFFILLIISWEFAVQCTL